MASYEIEESRALELYGGEIGNPGSFGSNSWRGHRSFIADQTSAALLAISLQGTAFPGIGGDWTPRCYNVRIKYHPFHVPGVALVVGYYDTPLIPGKAIVTFTAGIEPGIRSTIDVDGLVITGFTSETTNTLSGLNQEYEIVAGSNMIPQVKSTIIVQTAIDRRDFNADALGDIIGTINTRNFNIRGQKGSQTLRFDAYSAKDHYYADPFGIAYRFSLDPLGWNSHLKVQKGTWTPVTRPERDTAGALTGEYHTTLDYIAGQEPVSDTSDQWRQTPVESRSNYIRAQWGAIKDNRGW